MSKSIWFNSESLAIVVAVNVFVILAILNFVLDGFIFVLFSIFEYPKPSLKINESFIDIEIEIPGIFSLFKVFSTNFFVFSF